MNKNKIQRDQNQAADIVEDLTLNETEASIKGGPHFVAT